MLSLRLFFWSIRRLYSLLRWSLQALSQVSVRVYGILLFLGGLIAVGGLVAASLNLSPLAPTWVPSNWIVILGVLVLVTGTIGLYFQYLLHPGIIGRLGVMMLMLGTLVLVTGAATVDLFILPWMFKLIGELSSLDSQMQTAINQAMSGISGATTSSLGNAIGNGCKLASQLCNSTPVPSLPHATLPTIDGQSMVNKLLSGIGLASLDTLKICGLTFLSGTPLSLGCLLLSLTFLRAGLKSRIALLIIMFCALLNLITVLPILGILFPGLLGGLLASLSNFFLPYLPLIDSSSGIILFLSLAWLGFTLWSPWKLQIHLPWKDALLNANICVHKMGGWLKQRTSGQIKKK